MYVCVLTCEYQVMSAGSSTVSQTKANSATDIKDKYIHKQKKHMIANKYSSQ